MNGAAVPDITATYAAGVGASQNRLLIGPALMTVGAIGAVAGSFGDWLTSGRVGRSSYDILGLVDRLGFSPDGALSWLVRGWPLMPLLMTCAVVAAWWPKRWLALVFAIVGGSYAAALGLAVAAAVPERRSISVGAAPALTAVGGALVLLGSLAVVLIRVPSADADTR